MNANVDRFLKNSKRWREEMEKLRAILLKTTLEEEFKWRLPCYSFNDANVVIIQPFKSCLGLMFFKGTLLKDPKKVFVDNGPNSQASRRLEFRSVHEVIKMRSIIGAYVREAIAIEESGKKVKFKGPGVLPEELKAAFAKRSGLKKAFESLTPGRQRGYILHFSSAKQSKTRQDRIEKVIPRILKGKGLTDR